ncbi:hypothetical protein Y032_0050g2047 [Ancylostoma ceylanicum]|uniref:Uncharacterized protein n=1 Tax=Ancylostoma ceylanicum TaxID=53326 RepID=A0A016U9S4_9BILA|nr:hypothetical protein Y032_0050g2047 [Ancylostoma ceylanicum]
MKFSAAAILVVTPIQMSAVAGIAKQPSRNPIAMLLRGGHVALRQRGATQQPCVAPSRPPRRRKSRGYTASEPQTAAGAKSPL